MYVQQVQEGVIEYLQNPEQPWMESDRVVDKIVSRVPEATKTFVWNCYQSGAWDLDRLISETRKFRAQVPQHGRYINEMFINLILSIRDKEYNIDRFANGIGSLSGITGQLGDQQGVISYQAREFHHRYRESKNNNRL